MSRILFLRFFMIVLAFALPFQAAMVQGVASAENSTEADTEKAWLLSFVESRLSGPNRQIRISNVDGVLSSRASIGLITVADRQGIWLKLENAELDWNRLALL